MKRCRLKRCNFQNRNKMSKENKTLDKPQNGNDFIADVSDSLIFKDLTTLTITQSTEYLMFDIRDGNVTNTKYLNKEQTKKLKDFLNYR